MNNESLDLSLEEFEQLLVQSNELVINQYQELNEKKAYHDFTLAEVESWFDEPLPAEGKNNTELMEEVRRKVLATATNNLGPHMYGYVMSGGNQISTVAELLATTINQNATKWHLAPAMSEIEKRVIRWTTEMIGYAPAAGGVLVSGGSAANLTGLTVARNIFFEQKNIKQEGLFGQKPFVVYASDQVHSCVDKSVQILGIGLKHLRKIPTNDQFKIDTQALEVQINQDLKDDLTPFCLIGTAGTVNTGAIDDLDELAKIAKRYQMWFHVDGAYGALASALDSTKESYRGMAKADSIALDFHKWLYQPFEAGCTLVRDWSLLKKTYFNRAEYLDTSLQKDQNRLEFNEHCFQLSRNAKAFKVWMSIKSYGFDKIKTMIQKDIDLTNYLIEQLERSSDFEVKAFGLAVACFRYVGDCQSEEEIAAINQQLIPALEKDGRVFITSTKLKGKLVLRACFINHRKTIETTDYLLSVIREVAEELTSVKIESQAAE
ncbi:MAG: aminotransferase class I/II-fold pyridoxal phosphate-dependent enzyme [Bacteroidota bacterium]